MTSVFHAYQMFSTVIDGETIEIGSLTVPNQVTLNSGHKFNKKYTVSASTTKKLFDVSIDLSSFEVLLVASDFDVMLEMVTDDNSSIGDEAYTIGIRGSGIANKMGMWYLIPRDDSYANYTKNFGAGTLDLVEIIRVRNLSASQAAEVSCWAFK